jgi:hypothetical protein
MLLIYVLFRCRYVSEPRACIISTTVECDVSISVSVMLNLIHYYLLIYCTSLTLR